MDNEITNVKKSGIFSKIIEAIIYIAIVNFSYMVVMFVDVTDKYTSNNTEAYKSLWFYISIASLFIFLFNKMFETLKLSKTENILIVITSTTMIALSSAILAFSVRSFALPRSVIAIGFVIQTIVFIIIKFCMKLFYERMKKVKNIAVFCSLDIVEEVVENLFGTNTNNKEKLIYVTELKEFDLALLNNIDKVYIHDIYNSEILESCIHKCILKGIQVCIVPKSYEIAITKSNLILSSEVPVIKITQVGHSLEYMFIKRFIDIIFSITAIILCAPLLIIVYLTILITDGSGAIFKQKRVTRNNKEFYVYKFRTMVKDAEKHTGAVWASENDPRITKTGKFLRKYWLDELPQLFNILKGDMTIVGPRPERPELIREFVKEYPDFDMRTIVKCGLTGYAQVMAKYDATPQNKLKLDLFYILNANIFMDINIMILTARKMVLRFIRLEKKSIRYDEILEEWLVVDVKEDDGVLYYEYK